MQNKLMRLAAPVGDEIYNTVYLIKTIIAMLFLKTRASSKTAKLELKYKPDLTQCSTKENKKIETRIKTVILVRDCEILGN